MISGLLLGMIFSMTRVVHAPEFPSAAGGSIESFAWEGAAGSLMPVAGGGSTSGLCGCGSVSEVPSNASRASTLSAACAAEAARAAVATGEVSPLSMNDSVVASLHSTSITTVPVNGSGRPSPSQIRAGANRSSVNVCDQPASLVTAESIISSVQRATLAAIKVKLLN